MCLVIKVALCQLLSNVLTSIDTIQSNTESSASGWFTRIIRCIIFTCCVDSHSYDDEETSKESELDNEASRLLDWDNVDVVDWLVDTNHGALANTFQANGITGNPVHFKEDYLLMCIGVDLFDMTDSDLQSMGLSDRLERDEVLMNIAALVCFIIVMTTQLTIQQVALAPQPSQSFGDVPPCIVQPATPPNEEVDEHLNSDDRSSFSRSQSSAANTPRSSLVLVTLHGTTKERTATEV